MSSQGGRGGGRGRGGGGGGNNNNQNTNQRWQQVGPAGQRSRSGQRSGGGGGGRGGAQYQDPAAASSSLGAHGSVDNSPDVSQQPPQQNRKRRRRKQNSFRSSGGDGSASSQTGATAAPSSGGRVGGGGGGGGFSTGQAKWSDDEDEDEKKAHGQRARAVQLRNEKKSDRSRALINPIVHCLDESGAMSLVTMSELLLQGTQDIGNEADTPLIGPQDAGTSLHPMPPPLTALPPPVMIGGDPDCDPSPGMVAFGSADSAGSFSSLQPSPPQLPPHAFTHDGITTPNTLRGLAGPAVHRPLHLAPYKSFYRNLLFDYKADPANMTGAGRFSWTETPESRAAFVDRVSQLCADLTTVLKRESMMPTLESPTYVFGDIHGNFADLAFFLKSVLVFGDIHLSPCNILCLGDYVDRGPHSIECIVLLFALKLEAPEKVTLLRGNHEDRVVCGDRHTYGSECFLSQCQTALGPIVGMKLFLTVTKVFTYLPLAAEIIVRTPRSPQMQPAAASPSSAGGGKGGGRVAARRILCTHGGIPRFFSNPLEDNMIEFLRSPQFPRLLTLFPNNQLARQFPDDLVPDTPCDDQVMQKAWYAMFDFMWSDPTPNEAPPPGEGDAAAAAAAAGGSGGHDTASNINEWGFGINSRGSNVVTFSTKAVETFLAAHNYVMLFRAHQEKAHGIRLSKSQKVLTIFSSSNYLGHGNGAGCVVVSRSGEVQLIVKTG